MIQRPRNRLFSNVGFGCDTSLPIILLWLAVLAGLSLSVASVLKICSGACGETAKFTIFGMDFGWFGIAFFAALAVILVLRKRSVWADRLFGILIFAAAGAELRFIWLQKFVIEAWCPLCLWIAASVFTAAVAIIVVKLKGITLEGVGMKTFIKNMLLLAAAFAIGLTGAVLGVRNTSAESGIDPFLGNTRSRTAVYFISDWFCPACRKVEPLIEKMYPDVSKAAKVGFIDMPVHPETSNFTPYSLQFLTHEKGKYMQLRRALNELSLKTKSPTNEEVQAAVAPYGVKLRPLNFVEVMNGMKLNESIYRGFGVRATPTAVVTNVRTKKTRILVGTAQITGKAVKSAIAEVSK